MKAIRLLSFFFLLFVSFVFSFCNNDNSNKSNVESQKEDEATKGENVGSPLDIFVTRFLKNHPNIENNDVTFENARTDFAKEFDEQLQTGFLNNMVFHCLSVDKNIITKNISATFNIGATGKDSSYTIDVFLDAPVDETMAAKLKQYGKYRIQGTITRQKDKLAEKFDLGPRGTYFVKIRLSSPPYGNCISINVHRVKLDIKSYTNVIE